MAAAHLLSGTGRRIVANVWQLTAAHSRLSRFRRMGGGACFSASGIARRRQSAVGDGEGAGTVNGFSRAGAHARISCFSFFPFTASPSMHKCTVAQAVRGEGFAEIPFTHAFTAPDGDFGAVAPAFRYFAGGFSWFSPPGEFGWSGRWAADCSPKEGAGPTLHRGEAFSGKPSPQIDYRTAIYGIGVKQ